MNHLVFMNDGTQQVLTGDELNALDPKLWHGASPADLPRFVPQVTLERGGVLGYKVHDRDTKNVTDHDSHEEAHAAAAEMNAKTPYVQAVMDHLAGGSLEEEVEA